MTKITILLCLLFPLVSMTVFTYGADESHLSLKQVIVKAKEHRPSWLMTTELPFEPEYVRKHFFGDEAAFLRSIVSLLQEGNENAWDMYQLILFLDIDDESILKIVRNKFSSFDPRLQGRFCDILAMHPNKDNIDFLVKILKQTDLSVNLRWHAAYALAYFLTVREYIFENLDIEQKKNILGAFMSSLRDETKRYDIGLPHKFGDDIAFLSGYFGTFAEPVLITIKEKFNSIQDKEECSPADIERKINLAWAIVRIDPKPYSVELEFILQKAMSDESLSIRSHAISQLQSMPSALSEKVIPCLQIIIQKDASIWNKIDATEALKAMLEKLANETIEDEDSLTQPGTLSQTLGFSSYLH